MPKVEKVEAAKENQKKEHKDGAFKVVLGILMTCINPLIAFVVIKQAQNYLTLVTPFIKQTITIDNLEGKLNFLVLSLFYFAAFYFAVIIITIFFRVILFKPSPVNQRDPVVIVACQRILTNSLEQFVVFFANIAYFLLYTAQSSDKNMILTWVILFLASRVLFSVGYIFGAIINFSILRQTGFMIGFILNCLLTAHNLGLMNTLQFLA